MQALIVDDSRFLRERLKQMLTPLGWSFAEAANGVEALRLLSKNQTFDLMLLDINMPVMDGLQCLERMQELRLAKSMKVMMVTTEADATFLARAFAGGADEFLMKPMSSDTLQTKLLLLGLTTGAAASTR